MDVDELIEAVKALSPEERKEFAVWYTAFLATRQSSKTSEPPEDSHQ